MKGNVILTIEEVAQLCHNANKEYCEIIGDYSQTDWPYGPEWQRSSAINGVMMHLAELRKGGLPAPSASHEAWFAEKEAADWVYGPTKDPALKTHPCMVAYEDLPPEQKAKDYLFIAVVKAMFESGMLK